MTVGIPPNLEKHKVVDTESGCWLWLGRCNWGGYGQTKFKGKNTTIHRVAAHLFLGFDLNSPLFVLHKRECKYKECWNPEHLYIGTNSDNMKDAVVLKTHPQSKKTRCPNGHQYNKANTYFDGVSRHCRVCGREKQAQRKKRRQQNDNSY